MLYFEDIEVGEADAFGRYEVTREEVIEFARRYDPQPFHLSDEAAAQTHFGRIAASGWHSCSMTMAMIVARGKERPQAALGAAGIDELRWLKPVYPGDVLRVDTQVLDKRASVRRPGIGSLRTQVTTYNQKGEPVLRMIAATLIRCRPAADHTEGQ
ncbi:MaoC family dehydratase [Stakelama tenebrarum]|uniref:MaoC family dehydratase n=1 Tax=Stakelama tenebrarum TaxID=2711215 RepID=A0A6G6Y2R1_9SPHN|nr:MaoC family dehydratase [Sphingosinithalassobacter tenebrarum]QIG79131.1 MaoC family dehydratase [Sphingosinithalassobacter tenebrarum]